MISYERPHLEAPVCLDSDGRVIEYGGRWGMEAPPEDSYSVVLHQERFEPLHAVADALVAHLVERYDVDLDDDPAVAADLLRPRNGVVRAVRLRPRAADAAPLTFVCTADPGVIVHAGLLHDFVYPICGCEACDETWEPWADNLEQDVFAVVTGRYREGVARRSSPWVTYRLDLGDGWSSGGHATDLPRSVIDDAARRLGALPRGWQPWPVRS